MARAGHPRPQMTLEALARRSIEISRASQASSGAYPASPTLPVYRFAWLRDGAFVADAMSRWGEAESAEAFFSWCAQIVGRYESRIQELVRRDAEGKPLAPGDFLPVRFTLDGHETHDGWWNFQLDSYGAWLWALGAHADRGRLHTPAARYAPAVAATARYLLAFWDRACYSCWEENPEYVHVPTLAAIAAGLRSAADWPHVSPRLRARSGETVSSIERLVRAEGTQNGRLVRWLGGQELDAALVFCSVPYGLFKPDEPLMRSTVTAIERELAHPEGGVHRYLADEFYGGGEWIILAAALGLYKLALGDTEAAWRRLEWIADQADADGQLPEQSDTHLLHPERLAEWVDRWGTAARPLLWSHAMFLTLFGEAHVQGPCFSDPPRARPPADHPPGAGLGNPAGR